MPRPSLRKIGKYEILEVIGTGGLGTVYKARDPEEDRVVALKTLPRDLPWVPIFESEALTELRHPHLITIYDVGESETQVYAVTEYLSGRTLDMILRDEGPMPLERAIPVLEQLADALDYVHSLDLIHRDVKPSNIMVEEGQQGKIDVTLIDLGLMKPIEVSQSITSLHMVVGTPAYMAPEQFTGENVSSASDLYALGVVAYEMLTGRLPFQGKTLAEMLFARIQAPPDPRTVLEDIPASMAQVLLKALSQAPDKRYPTAMAMVEALREAQYGRGPAVHVPARKIDDLIAALRNRDNHVRQVAAEALGKLKDIQAVEPLATALRDENAYVRRAAVEALGRIGDARAIKPLILALRDTNIYARRAAAKALGEIGDARAVGPLIAALRDDKVSVRRAAAEALGKVGDVRAVEPLIAALADLEGAGAIAQDSSVAVGERGVAAGDIVGGSIVIGDTGLIYTQSEFSVDTFAVAQIEGHYEGTPLVVSQEYRLLVGILSSIPAEFVGVPVQLPDIDVVDIDVVVHTAGMEVLPRRVQKMRYFRGRDSGLLEFRLIPRAVGHKQILVEYYYEQHWLAQLKFEVEVAEAQELVPA